MIENKKLGEIAEIFAGARLSRFDSGVTKKQKVLKRTQEDGIFLDYEIMDISNDLNEKYYSKKDDIIVLLAGSNTVSKIDEEGYIIPMYYAAIRVKEDYDADFIYHLLKSEIFERELNRLVEGTTLKILKTNHLREINLPLPSYSKQKEYGELLSLMDQRINLKKESIKIEEKIQNSIINDLVEENQ